MRQNVAIVVAVFLLAGAVRLITSFGEKRQEALRLNHERCADEASEILADFLSKDAKANDKGTFVRVAGSGYDLPGPWNLEGQFYLSLRRQAIFTEGSEQIQVMVFKCETNGAFQPRPEHPMIYVFHTDLLEE